MNTNLHHQLNRFADRKPIGKGWVSAEILIPTGLILLSLVPSVGGTFRLFQLATGTGITPETARFFAQPFPVVAHIISVILYSLLGALQFAPRFRRRHLKLHRRIGRILIPAGFVTAISGLWMSHFYPWPAYDGIALYIMRLLVGGGMIIALVLATDTIRRRKFRQHGAWMIRAYALAMGAGTQVFSHIPIFVLQQEFTLTNRALAMGAGWLINILVAEWVIATRLRPTRRNQRGRKATKPILDRN
ncbi:MAG: DUF2306 domain-containing protein [Ardenticatenaceae bacterium]|nr:DUF2306 domain-containing protein [Ardenticatenaceae bacterium]